MCPVFRVICTSVQYMLYYIWVLYINIYIVVCVGCTCRAGYKLARNVADAGKIVIKCATRRQTISTRKISSCLGMNEASWKIRVSAEWLGEREKERGRVKVKPTKPLYGWLILWIVSALCECFAECNFLRCCRRLHLPLGDEAANFSFMSQLSV